MTWLEASSMSIALSISNMAAGLAGGIANMDLTWGLVSGFLISFIMMHLGVVMMSSTYFFIHSQSLV